MESISNILSIQNLANMHPSLSQMVSAYQQEQQIQREQQQQLPQASPIQPALASPNISPVHNQSNGNGRTSQNDHNNSTSLHYNSSNSSFASTNGHNGNTSTGINNNNNNNNNSVIIDNNPEDINLIDLITCKICTGYLIDATTLDLCMHSFCRPCALKYIKVEQRCPQCKIQIKDKRYLNRLKVDVALQNIVYKLVPGLYEKEMSRRRAFYEARPAPTPRYRSEMFGDIPPAKSIKPEDKINISLTWIRDTPNKDPLKTYLLCRADSTMLVLKKLIIGKFGLERPIKFYYGNSEILFDLTALMDIAATFNWSPEYKVLALSFKEQEISTQAAQAQN